MVTRSQIDAAKPELVLEHIASWKTAATDLETSADDYLRMVKRPGGSSWSGQTADGAITNAYNDRKKIICGADTINAMADRAYRGMTEAVMPKLTNVRAMVDNAERQGFVVNDDLSVSWERPEGMDDATAEKYQNATGPFSEQITAAGQDWWDAEQHISDQVNRDRDGLTVNFSEHGPGTDNGHDGVQLVDHHIPLKTPPLSDARRRAVEYADRWAGGPDDPYRHNPDYDYWGGEGNPGDCTNFASQVMRAGGFKDVGNGVDDWHRGDVDDWYYNSGMHFPGNDRSSTWSAARNNHDFITQSGRGQVVGISPMPSSQVTDPLAPSRAGLIPGDLIYYHNSDGAINHTAVYVGQQMQDGHLVDVVDQHAYGGNNFRNDWMPDSDHYWGGQAQAEFVHLTYPGE